MTTEQQLISMLQENVGTHFLDSGGFYGRNFEANALITDFESRPEVRVEVYDDTFSLTIDVYHFLKRALYSDATTDRLNKVFTEFCNRNEETWSDNLQAFCRKLGWKQSDIDGTNSYNHECSLSQTIQFWIYDDICILQIHGGCDVRGGYTKPVFFQHSEENSIWEFSRLVAIVEPKIKYNPDQIELIAGLPKNDFTVLETNDGGYSWGVDGCYSDRSAGSLFEVVDGQVFWDKRVVEFYI